MLSTHKFIRLFHSTVPRLTRLRNIRANPGVGHQIHELENSEEIAEDPEGFGDLESDFMNVHKSHRQHEKELIQQREKIRHMMVKHKYFRDVQLPNLLTYAEKEQIRLLHARDPEEWTAEKLAESFPATIDIVQKILESKWRPYSVKRIRKHDETVIRNWQKIRAGDNDLKLPTELEEHVKRFALRKREDLQADPEEYFIKPELPKPKGQEFQSLITSCPKYAEPDKEKQKQEQQRQDQKLLRRGPTPAPDQNSHIDLSEETYLLEKLIDKRKMRLQELKELKLTPAELAMNVPPAVSEQKSLEQHAAEKFGSPDGTGIIATGSNTNPVGDFNFVQKFESTEVVVSVADQKRYEMTRVKDRVHIPRKLWRQGATYRVEDCYYDDDGEFLYRVPGMTGKVK